MQTTNIEWADWTKGGDRCAAWRDKMIASRIGISVEAYRASIEGGLKWCTVCKNFHDKSAFNRDRSRRDGLSAGCAKSTADRIRRKYMKRARVRSGPSPSPARDMDKKQARKRVNLHVRMGRWPHPITIPCTDCGHVGRDRRHEYDHYLGYAAEHHEDVQAVCTACHAKREMARGRRAKRAKD